MKRLYTLFEKKNILSIYFTAGYPGLQDTTTIIKELARSGADAIEIGIPFSDPLADGPVIQKSSKQAIENGMTLSLLFEQLKDIRKEVQIPLILMGYFNSVLQFGVEAFCKKCSETGIDGLIIPDLPLEEYLEHYKAIFDSCQLSNILLVTPATSTERLQQMDENSNSFLYFVSANATTGNKNALLENNDAHFKKIKSLKHPVLIGFGIKDKTTFNNACRYAQGAIIGTAFINAISNSSDLASTIQQFIQNLKN